MSRWKRWLLILGLSILTLIILLLGAFAKGIPFLVDFWWFDAQGYEMYFWHRTLYKFVVLILVGTIFFLIFFTNFWIASHYLGTDRPSRVPAGAARKRFKHLLHQFQTGSLWVYTPFSIALAVLIAWPIFLQWESFLLYITAPDSGIQDPQYGKDVSYYLFSFPVYTLILHHLRVALFLLLLGMSLLYWIENRLLSQHGKRFPDKARWHLTILVGAAFLFEIWNLVLQRNALVYNEQYQPLFFGPGFVEMRIILPFIWLSMFFLIGIAISAIYLIHKHKGWKLLAIFSFFFFFSLGFRHFHFFHWAVNEYIVDPNEFSLQKAFIKKSIKATLSAYDLNTIEVRGFERERIPQDIVNAKVDEAIRNIPVWNKELAGDVYQQLQRLRTYYEFPGVSVDRYVINGNKQQVFLSGRELEYKRLPRGAQNWVNEHLIYTHGYGLVMTSAGQGQSESMDWLIRQIPLQSNSFNIDQPAIYYGRGDYHYAIAPSDNPELHYPDRNDNIMTHYQGEGGVPISSPFQKLIFASFFNEKNIFLTTQTNDESKILFRRNIVDRIHTLTPYLILDSFPYLVATSNGLYWIQDAYTGSSWYPNADRLGSKGLDSIIATTTTGKRNLNYIRNSVKIIVDAYNGTVDYYIFEPNDPIIQAFSRIYPEIFKSKEKMPAELRAHIRYPKDLFEAQMAIYAKYHQTDPKTFYQQEDVWSFAQRDKGESTVPLRPYYLTLDLIKKDNLEFILFLPMIVKERHNMRAIAVAGSDKPHYGKLVVHSFPKGELVFGSSQIDALIKEDPRVSALFTLWNQRDSEVILGNMIITPISGVVLYFQPVFLVSKGPEKIPRLERIILTDGQFVVIEPTVAKAYSKLKERIEARE